MTSVDFAFQEADTNRDGYLSENEFRNFVQRNSSVGSDFGGIGNGYGPTLYRASTYESSTTGGGVGGNFAYNAASAGGAGYRSSIYEASSYGASTGNVAGDSVNVNVVGAAGLSTTDATSASFSSTSQTAGVQQYETDAQGNFKDPNPQVIRRPAQGGPLTYSQNIRVRFLQPPAVPPPGPLIIKEVRPPQPPAPQPLRIRQQAPPLPQPPPLVLRERPPPTPAVVASQTVVRNLAAIPVPPRSVIIERIPPAPPKPRDIVIERWVQYGQMEKRKTIVQRAEAVKAYPKPQNVIIEYEPPQIRVVRQFQRLGVTPQDPQEYVRRYGAILLDSQNLVQQARAAGVVEDISPPGATSSVTANASEFSSSSSATGALGVEIGNSAGLDLSGGGGGGAARSSYFESSSYSATGDVSGLGAGFGGNNSSSFESSSYNSPAGGGTNALNAAFAVADVNNDGFLSPAEFRNAGF